MPQWNATPTWGLVRLPQHPWHKPAVSVVVAGVLPVLVLLFLDQVTLAVYTLSGSLTAVYAHAVPYRRRAGLHLRLVLGWSVSIALALTTAAATDSVWTRIVVVSVL